VLIDTLGAAVFLGIAFIRGRKKVNRKMLSPQHPEEP
jgi:hypothetical protein